ncbi:MAG: iron-containing alcohol dehydrogenase, partial [Lachnospiraceae bacterium]
LSEHTLPRFVKFAVNVMGVAPGGDDWKTAEQGIDALYRFFESIGLPMHLREVGIDESRIEEMAEHVVSGWPMDMAYVPLTQKDVADIFRACL